jgi:hypothetical protein
MGHHLASLVIFPPLGWLAPRQTTHQQNTTLGGGLHGRLVDFKGESGATGISYDTNIVCCAFSRRAWVSVCSVSVFTTKTSGVQHQLQDAFFFFKKKVVFVDPTQLGLHLSYLLLAA